jgi:hypothetical protein
MPNTPNVYEEIASASLVLLTDIMMHPRLQSIKHKDRKWNKQPAKFF